jgi:hypothetical protein
MTFSNASISARDVDAVAATAAGVTGLRAGVGEVTRARAGGAGEAAGGVSTTGVVALAAAVAAAGGVVFGTMLRATGRALGNGTLDLAGPSAAGAGMPMTSVRLSARAVERDAVARAKGVTAFLRSESFDRQG